MIKLAKYLAIHAHNGKRTAKQLQSSADAVRKHTQDENAIVTAWLQYTVLETYLTLDTLKSIGFPDDIVQAVSTMTRQPETTDIDYLNGIKANSLACIVKRSEAQSSAIAAMNNNDYSAMNHWNKVVDFFSQGVDT